MIFCFIQVLQLILIAFCTVVSIAKVVQTESTTMLAVLKQSSQQESFVGSHLDFSFNLEVTNFKLSVVKDLGNLRVQVGEKR